MWASGELLMTVLQSQQQICQERHSGADGRFHDDTSFVVVRNVQTYWQGIALTDLLGHYPVKQMRLHVLQVLFWCVCVGLKSDGIILAILYTSKDTIFEPRLKCLPLNVP